MPQRNSCLANADNTAGPGVPYEKYGATVGPHVITFPYQHEDDVNVYVENPANTYTLLATTAYAFGIDNQNRNTVTPNAAPGGSVHILRRTDACEMDAQFEPGASVRAQDLNHDFTQLLYLIQENCCIVCYHR